MKLYARFLERILVKPRDWMERGPCLKAMLDGCGPVEQPYARQIVVICQVTTLPFPTHWDV